MSLIRRSVRWLKNQPASEESEPPRGCYSKDTFCVRTPCNCTDLVDISRPHGFTPPQAPAIQVEISPPTVSPNSQGLQSSETVADGNLPLVRSVSEFFPDKEGRYGSTDCHAVDIAANPAEETTTVALHRGGKDKSDDDGRHHPDRGMWQNQLEFFLTCLGYTVGLGNVWRFPYLCYENGGGAFLIPYFIMLVFTGLPLYGLELCLGQYSSLGPNKVFTKLSPLFQGLGYGMLVVTFYTAIYYNVIIAWSLFYFFASFASDVPWRYCGREFNTVGCFSTDQEAGCRRQNSSWTFWNNTCTPVAVVCRSNLNTCLRVGDTRSTTCGRTFQELWNSTNSTHCLNVTAKDAGAGGPYLFVPLKQAFDHVSSSEEYFSNYMLGKDDASWSDFGGLKWDLVLCSALAWMLVAAALIKGVQSSGKVVYFTALFPYVVLFIFCIKGATLPGAAEGVKFFIQPKWELLLKPQVWIAAATQNFYSLGPAFGGLITFSSYSKFNHNALRDALLLGMADCATSFFAGSVVFAILGYMAQELGVPVGEVIKSGTGLAFIAYPDAISRMPIAPFWSILFFLMLMTCGFDSEFTMVETLITALLDEKPRLREHKGLVAIYVCLGGFLLGLSMCTRGGIYMFEIFDTYSAGWAVLILGLTECMVVAYVYGHQNFLANVKEMMPRIYPIEAYWSYTWRFTAPALLAVIVVSTWAQYQLPMVDGESFPPWADTMGWLMAISPLAVLFTMGVHKIWKAKKRNLPISTMLKPTAEWIPAHLRATQQNRQENPQHQTGVPMIETHGNRDKLRHTLTESTII